jgi:hypothetical protein
MPMIQMTVNMMIHEYQQQQKHKSDHNGEEVGKSVYIFQTTSN